MLATLSGSFAERSPADLLALCEDRRFSGQIEWESDGARGAVRVIGGFADDDGAAEGLLALGAGRFRLVQKLPTPDGGLLDDHACAAAIGPLLPAELLRHCERVGLTGTLSLSSAGRHVEVAYAKGEIDSISLDGRSEDDLRDAWSWTSGEWSIHAMPFVEPERPARPDESGRQFLDVVERTLVKILTDAREALPEPRRVSLPGSRPSVRPREDSTVRIYYLRDLVPRPVVPARSSPRRTISRTDLTEEIVDVPPGVQTPGAPPPAPPDPQEVRVEPPARPENPAPSPWPYLAATLAVAAATAIVLWLLD